MKFWNYKNADCKKIGNMCQIGGLRHYEFKDGKAKGVEAVEINTAAGLQVTALPGRGMDIAWISYRGVPLNYMSKTGVVSPAYYESCGMNWLHNFFAGGITTCGLLNVGGPEKVVHPVIGEREYGLHGRISNAAAEQVSLYEEWENGEYVMKVSGMVSEGILHGEHLTLRREITTSLGSSEFTIRDVVTNRASFPEDIMLLYHINLGYPLLDGCSRFVANSKNINSLSDFAQEDIANVYKGEEPVLGMAEKCYSHDLNCEADGTVKVALVNDELELGVAIEYNKNQLPNFNQWKMSNEKEYVVGLEPCTALPIGVSKAREAGMIQTIQPGESKTFEITYKILDGKDTINEYVNEINRG